VGTDLYQFTRTAHCASRWAKTLPYLHTKENITFIKELTKYIRS